MAKDLEAPRIQAAGAVLWRKSDISQLEIAVIHRPRYDDW
jgi:8-oxo-dGTP diphosphatase